MRYIKGFSEGVLRVVYTNENEPVSDISYFIENHREDESKISFHKDNCFKYDDNILFKELGYGFKKKDIVRYTVKADEKPQIIKQKTVDGEKYIIANAAEQVVGTAYEGTLRIKLSEDERVYGLGQNEIGVLNHVNQKEYLYQNNRKIPMPVIVSSSNYAVMFDCGCFFTYENTNNEITFTFDAVQQIDCYIIKGRNFDEIMQGIKTLAGTESLLPYWAFGYIQSKERYKSQQEILDTVEEFKKRDIPLSCIVLDWQYWENGKWGNKILDKSRFGDFEGMLKKLHSENVKFMISVWPNMNQKGENHRDFLDKGKLLCNLSTYDAFDEEARRIYYEQCWKELSNVDAWWCDSTEPFTPDWSGEIKKSDRERYELTKETTTKYLDARQANTYALEHARGIYENQLSYNDKKRVVNLTRSGWPSISKYGAILWSGDIAANWDTLKAQIAEGLNISLSGIPYWTLDIGAFFTGSDKAWERWGNSGKAPWFWNGDYEEGVNDEKYQELYTRWLQFGAFLPVMRSHGTDTPREPWHFTKYYDTIVRYIKLRYKLMPYIYSSVAMGKTLMRSLMFDFAHDKNVRDIKEEYMFGNAFLVCPVTKPGISEMDVYLPSGTSWFDYETKEVFEGGKHINTDTPIEKMPLFIRPGSIIPMEDDVIEIYEGADGEFELYYDSGDGYEYRNGRYSVIKACWNDTDKTFTLMPVKNGYKCPEKFEAVLYCRNGTSKTEEISYKNKTTTIQL